jgi:hypothetical protein
VLPPTPDPKGPADAERDYPPRLARDVLPRVRV